MRKLVDLRKIVDFINVTVTVLVGAYLIILCLTGSEGMKALLYGPSASWWLWFLFIIIGAILLGLNICVLYREIQIGGFGQYLSITTDQGTTNFFVPNLEMQLQRELAAEPDVVEPIVTLTPKGEGKPMKCEVELKLRSTKAGLKRVDEIKKRVRDIIDRLISGGLTVEVLVDVKEFVSEKSGIRPDSISGAGEFNGPVYTDGGGSESV